MTKDYKKPSAEKTVRDIRRATRRSYSAEENIRYVVTEETPPEYQWIHDRWPRLRRLSGKLLNGNSPSRRDDNLSKDSAV